METEFQNLNFWELENTLKDLLNQKYRIETDNLKPILKVYLNKFGKTLTTEYLKGFVKGTTKQKQNKIDPIPNNIYKMLKSI